MELQAFLVAGLLYLLPSVVAAIRRHPSGGAIFILNLLLGWTVLGWVVALIWSATGERGGGQPASPAPMRACPYCAEAILAAAVKCKHCGSSLEPRIGDDRPQTGSSGYGLGKGAARLFKRE